MPPAPECQPVPLFDLEPQHRPIRDELLAAVAAVADCLAFVDGEAVARFEAVFAGLHGVAHAIGMSSGTDALLAALMALDVGPGDEVITTPFTFISTAEAILRLGARPVFADIDPETFLISPSTVAERISDRTRAVIPVHLFGRACPMDELTALAERAGIASIEDCAQAMGARWAGRPVGSFGSFGAFSFFPTKNLGGWGDGGMLLCDDDELAEKARALRDHGAYSRGDHELVGGNFRLDTIQAAVLEHKLVHVDRWRASRIQAARAYHDLFEATGLVGQRRSPVVLPGIGSDGEHSFGLFVIRAKLRDELRDHLHDRGIGSGVYYPRPLHMQACLAGQGFAEGDFPATERAAREVLALPCFPGITAGQQSRVVQSVADFYRR